MRTGTPTRRRRAPSWSRARSSPKRILRSSRRVRQGRGPQRDRPRRRPHARADRRGHRHQRQDDRHDADHGDARRIGPACGRGGQYRPHAPRRGRRRRRRLRRRGVVVPTRRSRRRFGPKVAVLLGLADDHLDWHGTFDNYVAAKSQIFEHQHADDLLVFDADDRDRVLGLDARAGASDRRLVARIAERVPRRGRRALPARWSRLCVAVGHAPRAAARSHERARCGCGRVRGRRDGARCAGVPQPVRDHAPPRRSGRRAWWGAIRTTTRRRPTRTRPCTPSRRSTPWCSSPADGTRASTSPRSPLPRIAIRAVVAFGEAAPEVTAAFAGVRPVETVGSMHDAVAAGARLAARR